jgi:hypothetical protein
MSSVCITPGKRILIIDVKTLARVVVVLFCTGLGMGINDRRAQVEADAVRGTGCARGVDCARREGVGIGYFGGGTW